MVIIHIQILNIIIKVPQLTVYVVFWAMLESGENSKVSTNSK